MTDERLDMKVSELLKMMRDDGDTQQPSKRRSVERPDDAFRVTSGGDTDVAWRAAGSQAAAASPAQLPFVPSPVSPFVSPMNSVMLPPSATTSPQHSLGAAPVAGSTRPRPAPALPGQGHPLFGSAPGLPQRAFFPTQYAPSQRPPGANHADPSAAASPAGSRDASRGGPPTPMVFGGGAGSNSASLGPGLQSFNGNAAPAPTGFCPSPSATRGFLASSPTASLGSMCGGVAPPHVSAFQQPSAPRGFSEPATVPIAGVGLGGPAPSSRPRVAEGSAPTVVTETAAPNHARSLSERLEQRTRQVTNTKKTLGYRVFRYREDQGKPNETRPATPQPEEEETNKAWDHRLRAWRAAIRVFSTAQYAEDAAKAPSA